MTKDALRIFREDDKINLLFDKNMSRDALAILIKTAMKNDDLRDLLLTSAANLIANDNHAAMQMDTFNRVVNEIIHKNRKPDRTLS